jgi:AcrR family transcriptional regulator
MVRPRFAKLPTAQQEAILRAALEEFGTHGFHDASLNRVIEAAGISKGSMYYYFDGKGDLFAHVARIGLEGLLERAGPPPDLSGGDADAFWAGLEGYYLRIMGALAESPQLAAMLRGWSAASGTPAFQQAAGELEQAALPWIDRTIGVGQRVGAVRDDVPNSLLIGVLLGMGQAMDLWLLAQPPDEEALPRLTKVLMGMLRGAVAPHRAPGPPAGR